MDFCIVGPPRPYPTQGGYNPGGVVYPRQPAYNPGYPSYQQGNPSYIQPNHIYQQTGPSLPPNPSHTVIVLPGQSNSYGSSYGRTTGDIFKEALIHAGVNAAVHRLTSPNHYYDHYHHNSWNSYGTPPNGGSSISTTNTHTVNNYFGQPTNLPSNNGGSSSLPNYNPGQNYPNSGVQGGYSPQGVIYPNVNNGNSGSPGFTSKPVDPQFPSNGQSVPSQNGGKEQPNIAYNWPGGITDEELRNITEKLFAMDEPVYKFITTNLQNQTASNNTNATDASPQP